MIYTKKGDKGETGLANSQRISKNSSRIEAIGSVDEINSILGIVKNLYREKSDREFVEKIQNDLFTIGSVVAQSKLKFSKTRVNYLEKRIDKLENKLSKLTHFILPGGCRLASFLQLARSVVRRAERSLVILNEKEKVDPAILSFINRLSDLMFMLSREANYREGIKETVWRK